MIAPLIILTIGLLAAWLLNRRLWPRRWYCTRCEVVSINHNLANVSITYSTTPPADFAALGIP